MLQPSQPVFRSRLLITALAGTLILLSACRKNLSEPINQTHPVVQSTKGFFQPGEITQWYEWYTQNVKNAPKLLFQKAQSAVIKSRYYIRIPLENSTGMIYFTKTTALQAVFIRTTIKNGQVSEDPKQNMEFIDLNNFNYQVLTYRNKRPDSLYTLIVPKEQTASGGGNERLKTNGTFWFDLACVLTFGIPQWDDHGDRVCIGLNLFGWLANFVSGGDGGGGEIISGGYIPIGGGNNGSGDPGGYQEPGGTGGSGSPSPYIPVFGGDPYALIGYWESIEDDFYFQDDEPDDNSNAAGQFAHIPHSVTLPNGHVVTIEFGMTMDNDHADHMVNQRLVDALIGALHECASLASINTILIKATTNGAHTNVNSNHFKGAAIDISRINDMPIILMNGGTGNYQTFALQTAFENQPYRRENFGPHFKRKLGAPWSVGGHKDHLHFSITGY